MSSANSTHPHIAKGDHRGYMEYAISFAKMSPPSPAKFCVGALVVDADRDTILASGYSLELEGNTHAEQCCFIKIAQQNSVDEGALEQVLPPDAVLYTTMEPCNKRSPGNMTCVDRILRYGNGIKTVYVGIPEPEKFVGENTGKKRLVDAGIEYKLVEGLEDRIREVSTTGHTD